MNPIVHAEPSWLLAQGLRERRDRVLVTCAGLAPDLDGLSLMAGEEFYGRYHHVILHGYVGALVTLAACAALARQRVAVGLLSVAAFRGHLLCDLAGSGPDWPIHWRDYCAGAGSSATSKRSGQSLPVRNRRPVPGSNAMPLSTAS